MSSSCLLIGLFGFVCSVLTLVGVGDLQRCQGDSTCKCKGRVGVVNTDNLDEQESTECGM